jgi:hypothetical protein
MFLKKPMNNQAYVPQKRNKTLRNITKVTLINEHKNFFLKICLFYLPRLGASNKQFCYTSRAQCNSKRDAKQ